MADRVRNVQVHRPIIYGSHARLLTEEERATAPPSHTHRWTVFLTSAASPPPKEGELEDMDYLPGGADDLSYLIKRVTFKLHDTYTPSSRQFDKPPYKVTETGWGEFVVNIRVQFVAEASEKPLNIPHSLKLHHWGPPIDAPPPTPSTASALAPAGPGPLATSSPAPSATMASSAVTPAPDTAALNTPATEKEGDGEAPASSVKEASQPADADKQEQQETPGPGREQDGTAADVKTETAASTPAPTESIVAVQPTPTEGSEMMGDSILALQPVSIASKLPVHSWQYDELVFSDPPSAFLDILNEHPPTPLPAKLRRPRDQREKEEGPKQKKGKGRASTVASRAQTQEPGTSGTPAPAGPPVGIHGEPGSADVPLEFAKEMEVGEINRLTDVKIAIIEQMDKMRTRLIAQEKELGKLKAEMKV